jgi:CheY-like chemotaxis protein
LVVDDHAANRRLVEELLNHWKMLPLSVSNGPDAIAMLSTTPQASMPALIILDFHMPQMEAPEVAERLRGAGLLRDLPILLLSSADQPEEIERCRQAGLKCFLRKPFAPDELLQAIRMVLGQTERFIRHAPAPVPVQTRRALRVLVAEDNLMNQRLAKGLLEKLGCTVVLASNGREALRLLAHDAFDLVFMDVQMPELDGFQTTREIRSRETGTVRHQPIVAMTANAMKGDREACLAAGMDGYISKPIELRELTEMLDRHAAAHARFIQPSESPAGEASY